MLRENDFSKGSVVKNIMNMAVPMILAQLANVLYNIIDRIFIGRMPGDAFLALTGVGICLPIISMVMAFANLFGMGGAPLCSIERGRENLKEAENIMGNSFVMLVISGITLTIIGLIIKEPLLFLLRASEMTFPYANQYISIYLLGNTFVMISLGMNPFVNAQGFSQTGMITVIIGAVTNIILDPIFIYTLNMGVQGAALATVIAQFFSALWILRFLRGKRAILSLTKNSLILKKERIKQITKLGVSGFVMQFTNSLVQIFCNATLQLYGGDLYVGIMTVLNSIREFVVMPVMGLTNGAQPVIGFNYGAQKYKRVKDSIKFMGCTAFIYTLIIWFLLQSFPEALISIFNNDPEVIEAGIPMLKLFYLIFFMMSLQFTGQSIFVALGKARHAVFFSIFRKVGLVIPLIIILPGIAGLKVRGVFLAEPISQFIGGIACFTTMLLTVRKDLQGETIQIKEQNILKQKDSSLIS